MSSGAEDTCQQLNFTYDSSSYGQNMLGRLAQASWNPCLGRSFTERFSYTSAGLTTGKQLEISGRILEATYTYNNEGQRVSVTYPTDTTGPGKTYTYAFDALGRPNKLTDNQPTPIDWVKDVLYGPGSEMTQIKFVDIPSPLRYYTETRSYNAVRQLTQILTTDSLGATSLNLQYVYSATQNNGQITQSIDAVSGETVAYTNDSLNRLITAATTGPQWGLSFSYDGFGNRLSQSVTKGSGPSNTLSYNAANNRITSAGHGYDANGNLTTMSYGTGSMTLSYDIENRLTQAVNTNGTEKYSYNGENRRVYKLLPSGVEHIYFYGANGDKLGTYQWVSSGMQPIAINLYFAGRLVRTGTTAAFADRLGSQRNGMRYYPYGEEQGATANDRDKFATYFRDSTTGLDYAMNRYYGSNLGRFLSPDPYQSSTRMQDPQGWNPYTYVHNDPVKYADPSGLDRCRANDPNCIEVNGTYDRIGTIVEPLERLHQTTVQQQIDKVEGRDPLLEQGIGPCELMARKAEQIAKRSPAMSVEKFDEIFGKFYVGTSTTDNPFSPIRMWYDVFVSESAPQKSASGPFTGQADFLSEYRDKVKSDQTHHFAAYLSLGIHGHKDFAMAHALGDAFQNNFGDTRLGVAAFGLGLHLRNNPKALQDIGDLIRGFCEPK